jgi:hypothetical protein
MKIGKDIGRRKVMNDTTRFINLNRRIDNNGFFDPQPNDSLKQTEEVITADFPPIFENSSAAILEFYSNLFKHTESKGSFESVPFQKSGKNYNLEKSKMLEENNDDILRDDKPSNLISLSRNFPKNAYSNTQRNYTQEENTFLRISTVSMMTSSGRCAEVDIKTRVFNMRQATSGDYACRDQISGQVPIPSDHLHFRKAH